MENEFIQTIQNFTNVSNNIIENGKKFNNFKNAVEKDLDIIILHINELKKSVKKLKSLKQTIQNNINENVENTNNVKIDCEELKNKKQMLENEIKNLSNELVNKLNEKTNKNFDETTLKNMIENKNNIEKEIISLQRENEYLLQEIQFIKNQKNNLEYTYSDIVAQYDDNNFNEDVSNLTRKIKENEEKIKELIKLIDLLSSDNNIKTLNAQIDNYKKELQKLMVENKELEDKLTEMSETKSKLYKLINEINETIKQVTNKLTFFQNEQNSTIMNSAEIDIFIKSINDTISEIDNFIKKVNTNSSNKLSDKNIIPIIANKSILKPVETVSPVLIEDKYNTSIRNKTVENVITLLNNNNIQKYSEIMTQISKNIPNFDKYYYVLKNQKIKLNLNEIITGILYNQQVNNLINSRKSSPIYIKKNKNSETLINSIVNAHNSSEIQDILNNFEDNYELYKELTLRYNTLLNENELVDFNGEKMTIKEIYNCLNNWLISNPSHSLKINIENLINKIKSNSITSNNLKNTIINFSEIKKVLDECYENKRTGGYKKNNKSKKIKMNNRRKFNKSKKYNNKSKKYNNKSKKYNKKYNKKCNKKFNNKSKKYNN